MKLSDTIIGSIIIGVLVGGAILFSGGSNQDRKHAQIKVLELHSKKPLNKIIKKRIELIAPVQEEVNGRLSQIFML